MKDYMKIYNEWLSNPYFDEATKEELRAIAVTRMKSKSVSIWIWNLAQPDCGELLARGLTG